MSIYLYNLWKGSPSHGEVNEPEEDTPTREVQARSSHTRKQQNRCPPSHHSVSTATNSPPDISAETTGVCSSHKVSSVFISNVKEEPFHSEGENPKHLSSSTSRGLKQCQTDLNIKPLSLQKKAYPVVGMSTDGELVSSLVKQDPLSYEGQTLLTADNSNLTDHKQQIRTPFKEEPRPHAERSLSTYDIPTQDNQNPETFHVKEESCSGDSPQSDRSSSVLCIQVPEIKEESEEEESPDAWTSAATDYPPCLSIDIKQEEEDEHYLDASIHSFTITGEYIECMETKLESKAMQDKAASTSLPSPMTTYACPVCKRCFSNHGNLVRHRETHKGKKMSCSECGADFCNKTDLTVHVRTHKVNRTLYCSECNKTFQSNSHLIIHERIHTGEKPFSCSHCPKRFSSKSNLAEHMKVHTGAKQFCCSVCDKSYARKENLFSHQRIHKEAIIFTCSHCGQGFVDEHKFTRHQRFHTMEKPHPCTLCGKRFTHKALLLRHERTHLSGSLICSDCGKCFFQQAELSKHKNVHTSATERPFQCSECEKHFSSGRRLFNHQKLHVTEKAYKCSHCGNSFKQKNNLVRHQWVHELQKPFWCAECERGFTTKSNLKVHRRVHIMRRQHPCPYCGKEFPFKSRLNEHLKSHEEMEPNNDQSFNQ